MKKVVLLFLVLMTAVICADASTWVTRPTKVLFNDCPDTLTIVRYGCNYVTSGDNEGQAKVYVTVTSKKTVMFGCAYFKVYGPSGNVIFRAKKRLRVTGGGDTNVFAAVPAKDIGSTDIRAEVGVACDCNKAGFSSIPDTDTDSGTDTDTTP
jgi:hypothetical protein